MHGLDGAPGVVGHAVQLAHPPVGALDGQAVPRQLLGDSPRRRLRVGHDPSGMVQRGVLRGQRRRGPLGLVEQRRPVRVGGGRPALGGGGAAAAAAFALLLLFVAAAVVEGVVVGVAVAAVVVVGVVVAVGVAVVVVVAVDVAVGVAVGCSRVARRLCGLRWGVSLARLFCMSRLSGRRRPEAPYTTSRVTREASSRAGRLGGRTESQSERRTYMRNPSLAHA